MIQIYSKGNIDYNKNGDMTLLPASCVLEATLNGSWVLTLEHPLDDQGRWKYIAEDAVIQCDTFMPNPQRFRIYEKNKGSSGVVAYARPVFQDTKDTLLIDVRPTEKTGQEALDIMLAGTGFTGKSDITARTTAYYVRKNIADAILGSDENAFANRWGGEAIYDNETITMNARAGGDYGVSCEFGKNLVEIEETVNLDDVITRIVPVSFNGYTLDEDTPWVDSPNIEKYATVRMREVQFQDIALASDKDGGYETLEELQEALRTAAKNMFTVQGVDKPLVNYVVDMVNLASTVEYQGYKMLETIGLGDTVRCRDKHLGIDVPARAIRVVYDCIRKINSEVELGSYQNDYFSRMQDLAGRVQQTITPAGEVKAGAIQGVIDCAKAMLRAQKSIAQKQQVRAMLFEDLDPESDTYGAMCIGTMGFEIASQRTADGRDWDWRTFGTGAGFVADMIVAGTMLADRIKGGILTLGGQNNGNGVAEVLDASGNKCVQLTKDGINAIKGIIAGWSINNAAIYKDVTASDGTIYRVYFQPPITSVADRTWVLSCQKSTDGGATFYGSFVLYSDGSAYFGNNKIKLNADGSAQFGKTKISADGAILSESDIGYVNIYDGNVIWGAKVNGAYKTAGCIITSKASDGTVTSTLDAGNVMWEKFDNRTPYTGGLIFRMSDGSIKGLSFENGVLMSANS